MRSVLLTVAIVFAASSTFGFQPSPGHHTIRDTPHDLGRFGADFNHGTNTEEQICIYCHTPHNAEQAIPLWNRQGSRCQAFYETSPTVSGLVRDGRLASGSISLFCMSCHDGVTAVGAIRNDASLDISYDTRTLYGNAAIGHNGFDLSHDHPIGFDYTAAYNESYRYDHFRPGLNHPDAVRASMGKFLFTNPLGEDNQLECASCHKVHDNFFPPFLRMPNYRSALCLACHDK